MNVEANLGEELSGNHTVLLARVEDHSHVADILALGTEPVILLKSIPGLLALVVRVEGEGVEILHNIAGAPGRLSMRATLMGDGGGGARAVTAEACDIALVCVAV